jgi:hypothetical protein
MRMTLTIDDDVLDKAKAVAARVARKAKQTGE